ncbi:hypothetical protein F5Y19DRAFT_438505 [Xylariaceae sp. FL1651]|nr:hypothetical protein F5Y19DRAFT_438505 [Xylariaceae sp. FL1651]
MSLILSSAGRLKPEVRLAQAIAEFQAALSKEQQAAFQAGTDVAISSQPQLRDMMQVTAEIDLQARMQNGGGRRCFGSRVTKALESIQQFVAVGDILIGGSQNLIACGVWSLVRLSLITAARFSTYLDKLSSLLMVVGRTAPRYQEIVVLYPKSKALQNFGLEYLISVVNLCRQVVTVCNQSGIGQLKSFFKDLDVGGYQTELLKWANAIKEQLSIEEARQNSEARSILSKFSDSETFLRKINHRVAFLDACSTFDYQMARKQSRRCGDATWFAHNQEFIRWRDHPQCSVLLVSGKLGAGKTVTLANILDDLILNTKGHAVVYMFCRGDYAESQKYGTVIGCLARQILEALLVLDDFEHLGTEPRPNFDPEDIKKLFNRNVLRSKSTFVVVDGIDECGYEDRALIVGFLQYLRDFVRLKVCISYRLSADTRIRNQLEALGPDNITLQMPEENPDIATFIQARLEGVLESGKLAFGDPTIILEISQALEAGAQGMFLWVALQIEAICAQKTDNNIRAALRSLPKDLPKTFIRSLATSKSSGPEYQERLLKILVASVRPLTIEELREAISVIKYYPVWDPSNLINDVYGILATGGSLLTIDEEQDTVHFVHPSVKQFLLGNLGENEEFHIDSLLAGMEMAEIVITYLNYNVFDTQVTKNPQYLSAPQVCQNLVSSTLPSGYTRSIALAMLRSRRRPSDFNFGKTVAAMSTKISNRPDTFQFHPYARAHWIAHLRVAKDSERLLHMATGLYQKEPPTIFRLTRPAHAHYQKSGRFIIARGAAFPNLRSEWPTGEVDLAVIWAVENSHYGIFWLAIRKSIRNIIHIVDHLRLMHLARRSNSFQNLDSHMCLKLFCLAALFNDYTICEQLLRLVSSTMSWADILTDIPKTLLNGQAIALVLVQAQALSGFCRPSLEIRPKEMMMIGERWKVLVSKDFEVLLGKGRAVALTAGEEVIFLDEDELCFAQPSVRVSRLTGLGFFTVPWGHLRCADKQFFTCCKAHVGILVGKTRLCSCCVSQQCRQFVNQFGDLDLEEERPHPHVTKFYKWTKEDLQGAL